jgi:general secretion pathway protein G
MQYLLKKVKSYSRHEGVARRIRSMASGREEVLRQLGFTLLELVIAMTIMITLASISVVGYEKIQQKTKETLLKDDLKSMRKLIDQYGADKEELPQSLDDLVTAGYIREVPLDPIYGQADWDVTIGDDPLSRDGKQGITDIHSKAAGVGSDGKSFSTEY